MYIKRNVYFSAIDQETGEEKLFCVNEVLDEDTYLERLYSEGEEEKKSSTGKKVAKGAGIVAGTAAAGAGAAYGGEVLANKAGDAIVKKIAGKRGPNGRFVKLTKTEKTLRDVGASMRDTKTVQNLAKKAGKALKIVK